MAIGGGYDCNGYGEGLDPSLIYSTDTLLLYGDPFLGFREPDDPQPTIEDTIKNILTELLHSDQIESDTMERFVACKEALSLAEDEIQLAKKRVKLIERLIRQKM